MVTSREQLPVILLRGSVHST